MDHKNGETMATVDGFLEHVRSGQIRQDALKKRFGRYRTKEVDRYVQNLQERISGMEEVFQEKYAEMRTSLLCMTKERDELEQRARFLEKEIKDAPERCAQYLKEQGYVPVLQPELERLRGVEARHLSEIERLRKENRLLMSERDGLKAGPAQEDDPQGQRPIQAQKRTPLRLETAEPQKRGQEGELLQARAQMQALETQYRLAQEMAQRLLQEKERLEKDLLLQKERSGAEKAALIRHYQNVLHAQRQILQRLHETFSDSVRCIGSLNKAEGAESGEDDFYAKSANG